MNCYGTPPPAVPPQVSGPQNKLGKNPSGNKIGTAGSKPVTKKDQPKDIKNGRQSNVRPITGPEERPPPPEACGPAMSRVDDRKTSSRYGGDSLDERLMVPTVGSISYLNVYDENKHYAAATVTQKGVIKRRGDRIDVYHRPTGPGIMVFHAPEFQDYHLYGQSVTPEGNWPRNISANAVLFHNQGRTDGNSDDDGKTIIAIGGALPTTHKPSLGAYLDLDLTEGGWLCIIGTDSAGADDDSKGTKIKGGLVIESGPLPASGTFDAEIRSDNADSNILKVWNGSEWEPIVTETKVRRAFRRNLSTYASVESEFLGVGLVTDSVVAIAAGAGAGVVGSNALDKTNHPGVWGLSTGTDEDGRIFIIGGSNFGFHIGVGGIVRCGTWFRTPGSLSTVLEDYTLRTGIFNIALPNSITEGLGFEYDRSVFGGNWQLITEDAAETSEDSGITVAIDTWYLMEVEVNAAGTIVEFFLDGVSVGILAVAANIPNGTVLDLFYNSHIMKLGGTTARVAYIDAYYLDLEITR